MHNGVKVIKDGYCGSWTTDLIYGLKGHHEPQEEKVFHEVLKYIPSQASMIEIGSYWAYYSLWFAKAIQGATNYLIEPVAIRSEVGRQNFELNDFPSFIFQGYVGHYDPQDVDGKDLPKIELDEFLRENGIDHVAIVHSDIQGAEYEMLQSAKASMEQGRIDFFFVSTHGQEIHDLCLSFLVAHQYDIIAEHSPEESFSCDGLIVGKRSGVDGPEEVEISKALLKR